MLSAIVDPTAGSVTQRFSAPAMASVKERTSPAACASASRSSGLMKTTGWATEEGYGIGGRDLIRSTEKPLELALAGIWPRSERHARRRRQAELVAGGHRVSPQLDLP